MYNRLFTKILDSSIWLEKDTTRIVWITLLAAMDEDGFAAFSCNENLSRRANVPMERLVEALNVLESPDAYNPNDEYEGRRIEKVPNGWLVLKAPVYRSMMSREIQREQTRIRVAEHRAKQKPVTNKTLQNVTNVTVTPQSRAKQSTSEEEAKKKSLSLKRRPESFEKVLEYGKERGASVEDCTYYWDQQEAGGWKRGGEPIADWKASFRTWQVNGFWKNKGSQYGSNSKHSTDSSQSSGTLNEGKHHLYKGVGKVD